MSAFGRGKKQFEQLSALGTSIFFFGLSGFVAMVYITDWRVIADYIPYYNGKFCSEKKKET